MIGAITFSICGGLISRWHGGGFVKNSPKILKAFIWSAPFAFFSYQEIITSNTFFHSFLCFLFVLGFSMLFKNTGHGGGMDLAHSLKEPDNGREPEKLEYLILFLHGKIPQYFYDLLLLSIIGFFSTLGCAVVMASVNPSAGLFLSFGGLLGKPLGYSIGWLIYPSGRGRGIKYLNEATAIGEFLTGFITYLFLWLAVKY